MKLLIFLGLFILVGTSRGASIEGVSYFQQGDYEEARKYFINDLKVRPSNVESLFMLGNTYFRLDEYSKARLYYFKALSLAPRDPDLIYNYNLTQKKLELKSDSLAINIKLWPGELALATLFFSSLLIILIFYKRNSHVGKMYKYATAGSLTILVLLLLLANYPDLAWKKEVGVITGEGVDVYSGTDSKSVSLYKVPKGTLVDVQKKVGTHLLVKFNESEQGWVSESELHL